ncbi:hypothetical protein E2C01_002687 [Portunus trituberculatus]|uniref:Uncharacterized protein n=1 Tax=Portunus trituberculatus TaxID=210409 RepID=A0A5B7CKZ6_PORTR|nr:hypothetical protein [Portunus trituberculatus]
MEPKYSTQQPKEENGKPQTADGRQAPRKSMTSGRRESEGRASTARPPTLLSVSYAHLLALWACLVPTFGLAGCKCPQGCVCPAKEALLIHSNGLAGFDCSSLLDFPIMEPSLVPTITHFQKLPDKSAL